MARGRMLVRTISTNPQVAALADSAGLSGVLIFTWLIPWIDVAGRMIVSPARLKYLVFPSLPEIDLDEIELALVASHNSGLLVLYKSQNEYCAWFPGFTDCQRGLRRNRENPSEIVACKHEDTPQCKLPLTVIEKLEDIQEDTISECNRRHKLALSRAKVRTFAHKLKSKSNIIHSPVQNGTASDVLAVFAHYRTYHPRAFKNPKSTSKEWKAIKARLAEGSTVDDLCLAIDGCHRSPWHQGRNDRKTKYDSLELITRSGSKVIEFIALAEQHPASSQPSGEGAELARVRELVQPLLRRYRVQAPIAKELRRATEVGIEKCEATMAKLRVGSTGGVLGWKEIFRLIDEENA